MFWRKGMVISHFFTNLCRQKTLKRLIKSYKLILSVCLSKILKYLFLYNNHSKFFAKTWLIHIFSIQIDMDLKEQLDATTKIKVNLKRKGFFGFTIKCRNMNGVKVGSWWVIFFFFFSLNNQIKTSFLRFEILLF